MPHIPGHKFDENQPRDESGKWSKIPGYINKKAVENMTPAEQKAERLKHLQKSGVETIHLHRDAAGNWMPDRERLHETIIQKYLGEGHMKTGSVHFMGGGPGNGKSSLLDGGFAGDLRGRVRVDPDGIKALLPEYEALTAAKFPGASSMVHEESSYISKQLIARASEQKLDMAIDTIGDGGLTGIHEKIAKLRQAGYTNIRADYVSLDTNLSMKLIRQRFEKTGRYVPRTFALEMNREISKLVPGMVDNNPFDEFKLWDTNESGKPRLILSAFGNQASIYDQPLYDNFLKKAHR